jgi:hypothetical protein
VPIYLAHPFHILERGTLLIIADKLLK